MNLFLLAFVDSVAGELTTAYIALIAFLLNSIRGQQTID